VQASGTTTRSCSNDGAADESEDNPLRRRSPVSFSSESDREPAQGPSPTRRVPDARAGTRFSATATLDELATLQPVAWGTAARHTTPPDVTPGLTPTFTDNPRPNRSRAEHDARRIRVGPTPTARSPDYKWESTAGGEAMRSTTGTDAHVSGPPQRRHLHGRMQRPDSNGPVTARTHGTVNAHQRGRGHARDHASGATGSTFISARPPHQPRPGNSGSFASARAPRESYRASKRVSPPHRASAPGAHGTADSLPDDVTHGPAPAHRSGAQAVTANNSMASAPAQLQTSCPARRRRRRRADAQRAAATATAPPDTA